MFVYIFLNINYFYYSLPHQEEYSSSKNDLILFHKEEFKEEMTKEEYFGKASLFLNDLL